MIKGFREFMMRGNVVDLAIAVVIGTALAAVIDSLVTGFINPLIAMVFKQPSLQHLTFEINEAVFMYGAILDALITFVAIGAAVYFIIVVPMNKLAELRKRGVEPEPEAKPADIELLEEIRDLLRSNAERGA